MKKYSPFLLILFVATIAWAALGFSTDFLLVSGAIGTILTGMKFTFDFAKSWDDRFSPKSPESPFNELKRPIPVQMVSLEPISTISKEKTVLLKELRLSPNPISRKHAIEHTRKILGERKATERFWKQVEKSTTLGFLAQNPFMLEGLVLLFEQCGGSFPRNEGEILSQILSIQFSKEKLNLKSTISLDIFNIHLGKLSERHYPALRFPDNRRHRIFRSPYSEYDDLIQEIGFSMPSIRLGLWTIFVRWILGLLIKDPNKFFSMLEELPQPWQTLLLIPFYFLFDPIGFSFGLLAFPFTLIERKISRYVHHGESNDFLEWIFERPFLLFFGKYSEKAHNFIRSSLLDFHDFVSHAWEKYEDFKLHARRFFDRFNLRRIQNMRRGELILKCAKQAGVLESDGEDIWFTHEFWRDYFTAIYLVEYDEFSDFFNKRHSKSEDSIHEGEKVGVMMCGLHPEPITLVKKISALDPAVATDCFVSLKDADQVEHEDLKKIILALLVNSLKRLPYDGNGPRCNRIIRSFRKLTDNPYYAYIALEKLPSIYGDEGKIAAARNIATFGVAAYNMLIDYLDRRADGFEKKHYLIALGELGDARAIPIMQALFKNASEPLVRVWAVVVLATYFADPQSMVSLEKMMRYEAETDAEMEMCDATWKDVDFNKIRYVTFALDVLERAADGSTKRIWRGTPHDPWSNMQERFVNKMGSYKDNRDAEKLLLEHLEKSNQPRFTILLVRALGTMESKAAAPRLLEFLNQNDEYLIHYTIEALGQIGSEKAIFALIGFLFLSNLRLVKDAIQAIGQIQSIESVSVLIEKLESVEILVDEYSSIDSGYPIAYLAMLALVQIGNYEPKGTTFWDAPKEPANVRKLRQAALKAATQWCCAHLESKQKIGYERETLGEKCKRYMEYEINYRVARRLIYAWMRTHSQDKP